MLGLFTLMNFWLKKFFMLACDASLCRVNLFSCDFKKKTKKHLYPYWCLCLRDRRPTWAEERRMNAETFGIPLRHNRGRGGFRGRGFMGPRGGRGRPVSRGSFGPPRGAPPGFRGGFRGGRGGRDFSDFEYRVNPLWTHYRRYKMDLASRCEK